MGNDIKVIQLDEMVTRISHCLNTSPGEKAVYTMLLGAGFSYGVIPIAKEILREAPVWLYKKSLSYKDETVVDNNDICRAFWRKIADQYADGNGNEKLPIGFNKENSFPDEISITNAYQYLMSGDCPGGLTTPSLRREYIRSLHKSANKNNNPAHLYLACLLNQQRKKTWGYKNKFCKTILTTNFDPLLQSALQLVNVLYYMSDRPEAMDYLQEDDHDAIHLVYTHGSIHRYLLLNAAEEIDTAARNSSSLKNHFERHGIIVLGYGGWQDATMTALQQATQFDGNLYWCVRKSDSLSDSVQELLKKHAGCAYKVIIPDADEAMHKIFKELSGLDRSELLNDPISLVIEQMEGLSFSETEKLELTESLRKDDGCDSNSKVEKKTAQSGYIDNFNSQLGNTIAQLKIAREAFLNPEKYNEESSDNGESTGMKKQAIVSKHMGDALALKDKNDIEGAIEQWSKVVEMSDASLGQRAQALMNRAMAYRQLKPSRIKDADDDYDAVIGMQEATPEVRAYAHLLRGLSCNVKEPPRLEDAVADFSAVIEMPDAPAEQRAMALQFRGDSYTELDQLRFEDAIIDYTAVIEMLDVPIEQRAIALVKRGSVYGKLDPPKIADRIADYTSVIEMPDAPIGERAMALNNRGIAYGKLEPPRIEEQIADYTTVIEMSDVTAKDRASAFINRGIAYDRLEQPRIEDEIEDYTAVIEMSDATVEQRVLALNQRSMTYSELEPPRTEDAIAGYTAVIEMPDASIEQRANAYDSLGLLFFKEKDDVELFSKHVAKAAECDNSYVVRYNLGLSKLFSGIPEEATKWCLPAINECEAIGPINYAIDLLIEKKGLLPEKSNDAYEEIMQALLKRKTELE